MRTYRRGYLYYSVVMSRLDQELVIRGLSDSRTRAQRDIKAGMVRVNDVVCTKPSHIVSSDDRILCDDTVCPYVGIAALKLAHLLDMFPVLCQGARCLDIGASTGGFTQILLLRGASHVTAVDVGHMQMHASLRDHPSLTLCEDTDIRDFLRHTAECYDLITVDVSFISIQTILPLVAGRAKKYIFLIKPQFETPPEAKNKRGVVTDPAVHEKVLHTVNETITLHGLYHEYITASRIIGGSGNREYFIVAGHEKSGYNVAEKVSKEVHRNEDFFVYKPE